MKKSTDFILLFLFTLLFILATPVYASEVIGVIDNIDDKGDDGAVVRGWACQESIAKSISIHLYAGGKAGIGEIVKGWTANVQNEIAVSDNSHCRTPHFLKHRFRLILSNEEVIKFTNKAVYIHGISTNSDKHHLLSNSGKFSLPHREVQKPGGGEVIGVIDGVDDKEGEGAIVRGWACQEDIATSINIELYVGGAAGVGEKVKTWTVNSPSGAIISDQFHCHTPNYFMHRFNLKLTNQELALFESKTIFVHGISTTSNKHNLLTNSGKLFLPKREVVKPIVGEIIGVIDGVDDKDDTGAVVRGWACQEDIAASINIELYAGGAAGVGEKVKTWTVNSPSGAIISDQSHCRTPNYFMHRFNLKLTNQELILFESKTIFVHGLSTSSDKHKLLVNSGKLSLPKREVVKPVGGKILGVIDGVDDKGGAGVVVHGWACQEDIGDSINIELYVDGAAGTGEKVKVWTVNSPSGAIISDQSHCNTPNYFKHRFHVNLTFDQVKKYNNQAIYVHGVSVNNIQAENLLLSNSGKFNLPYVDTSAPPILLSEKIKDYQGGILNIAADENVLIDTSINVGLIKLAGQLICPEQGTFSIESEGILVTGSGAALICGSEDQPYLGEIEFILKGNKELSEVNNFSGHQLGAKGIVAMNDGLIQLIGIDSKKGWSKLSSHAEIGNNSIQLRQAVQWEVGDDIVIGATGFDPRHAETFKIKELLNGHKTVVLDKQLKYFHWGKSESFNDGKSKSWILDESAEVANLTRNIRVQSAVDTYAVEQNMGAHMMIMGSGVGHINSVEFTRVGQMGKMGRYPFHWHRRGNVYGQYIKNSSIHNSYNRCVTIHGTQHALVERNTCYNHFGHGFFLEDGNETKNILHYNLGMLTKRVEKSKSLLVSDVKSNAAIRFAAPATFWISNPDNDIYGNVASGSEGSGFWMAFQKYLDCNFEGCQISSPSKSNVFPIFTDTLRFDNNIAHSSAVGITHDGAPDGSLADNSNNPNDRNLVSAHYSPHKIPEFKNLVAYKNSLTGIYYRGQPALYSNAVMADNGVSAFFAYNQVLQDSLIVGLSANHSVKEMQYLYSYSTPANRRWKKKFAGVFIYDGPFNLENVHFANFPENKMYYNSTEMTPTPFVQIGASRLFVNSVRELTFNPKKPFQMVDFSPTNWLDSWAAGIKDLDGTLTGIADSIVAPLKPLNGHHSCDQDIIDNAYVCQYEMGHIAFAPETSRNYIPFSVARSDGARQNFPRNSSSRLHSKFSVILEEGYKYTVEDFDISYDSKFDILFTAPVLGDLSPIIKLDNLKRACYIQESLQVSSLDELAEASVSSYFATAANDLYFKILANDRTKVFSADSPDGRGLVVMRCEF